MQKFDDKLYTSENVDKAMKLHAYYAKQVTEVKEIESVTSMESKYKADIITKHAAVQEFLRSYFSSIKSSSKNAVTSGSEILRRRAYKNNELDENGEVIKQTIVDLGIKFIHDEFNDGELFPLSTFFTMFADSGVGKSEYFYKMIDTFLVNDFKVLLCSFEFGDDRLGNLIDDAALGGKDRMRKARLANKFDNLFVNYYARDLESLELMIDIAHKDGIKAIFIDSFGEVERNEAEYILQQKISMMINAKKNDYGIFIGMIGQTKTVEVDGDYTVRGGKDLIYKPDLSIHIKKVSAEDTSGDRIVHLFKNREKDLNGKTIVTAYDFETREPRFKHLYEGKLDDGKPVREFKLSRK